MREDKALPTVPPPAGSIESIRKEIEARITIRERISTSVEVPLSAECKRILNMAGRSERSATNTSEPSICCWDLARRKVLWRGDLDGRGLRLSTLRESWRARPEKKRQRRGQRKLRCWRN